MNTHASLSVTSLSEYPAAFGLCAIKMGHEHPTTIGVPVTSLGEYPVAVEIYVIKMELNTQLITGYV